jgi:hypothetical protein
MEQLDEKLPYRWFVGLGMDEAGWVPTSGGGSANDRAPRTERATSHAQRRQGLRHARFRCRPAAARRCASPGAERHQPALRHRPTHHAAFRLFGELTEEKAHRRIVQLGQNDRRLGAPHDPRRRQAPLQIRADHGELQAHPHTKAARGGNLKRWQWNSSLHQGAIAAATRVTSLLQRPPNDGSPGSLNLSPYDFQQPGRFFRLKGRSRAPPLLPFASHEMELVELRDFQFQHQITGD